MKVKLNPTYESSEKIRLDYFRDCILRQLLPDKRYRVLDVGCSQLEFNEIASNVEVFGLDYIHSAAYDEEHFILCDLNTQNIPFENTFFDFVVAGEIIEHLKRPFEFIEEVSRILKKGGLLLLSTPNPHYYLEILKDLFGIFQQDDPDHLNLFSKIHLIAYCSKASLKLVTFKRYKFWFPWIKLMILSLNTPRLMNYQNVFVFRKE